MHEIAADRPPSMHPSATALPADGHHLVAEHDRRHHAGVGAVAHELGAPVLAGGGVALLELDALGAQGLAGLFAVGAAGLYVHHARVHTPTVAPARRSAACASRRRTPPALRTGRAGSCRPLA